MKQWRHVFKLDPAKTINDRDLERLCLSKTDAFLIGGSTDVTYDNTVELLSRIRPFQVTCVLELSSVEAIVPGFDLYFIPMVLNSRETQWMVGRLQQAVRQYGSLISWELICTEGYVMLNPESTAAQLTQSNTMLDREDIAAYARVAEHVFHLPILYLEYSGTFGDMEIVRYARSVLKETRLFYGGGINSLDKARQALEAADTIVVGNVIYEDMDQALETVVIV